jgi:hypothetical protein
MRVPPRSFDRNAWLLAPPSMLLLPKGLLMPRKLTTPKDHPEPSPAREWQS